MKKGNCWILLPVLVFLLSLVIGSESYASSWQEQEEVFDPETFSVEEFQNEDIQRFLDSLSGADGLSLSFQDLMRELARGNLEEVLKGCSNMLKKTLFAEIRSNRELIGQIVILALIGAMFSGFSGIFGSGHVSETGFYVVYLLTMTFLAAGFFSSVKIAADAAGSLLGFMKAMLPAYFMAMAAAGGALTSASVCGFTLGAIGLVQSVLTELLIPLTRIYMLLVLAGNFYKEDMISKITELLGQGIRWGMKAMFGAILGFHVIQGMILPQADALKNASVLRLAQAIPGLGGGIGAVSQIVMGSGVLIKNTAGAAAVIVLLVLATVPIVKLGILMILYYLAAAIMQPVCDKRLVACMTGAAAGHGLLLQIVGYSLALFVLTIAVLCVSTNAVWYAG